MIPLTDFYIDPKLLERIHRKVISVIDSKSYILGKELANFEKAFANFAGVKFAIGVASGTDALRLAMRAVGVKPGDKILTVAFTSPFTVLAIIEEGAIPVFCDVDSDTMTIDVFDARKKLDSHVRAIIPVHLYGNPCNMDEIVKLCRKNNLILIEDACQAHGAIYKGTPVGNFGKACAFSFYPTKNLGAMGDAGMLVTNDAKVDARVRKLRHGGQSKRFWHEFSGINSRLDEIQAVILSAKLKLLKDQNNQRRRVAERYRESFADLPIKFQKSFDGGRSIYHLFVIRTQKRKQLKEFLFRHKIISDIYYPYPIYKQTAFKKFANGSLPVTEKLSGEILALPIYPNLSVEKQDLVIAAVRSFFKNN